MFTPTIEMMRGSKYAWPNANNAGFSGRLHVLTTGLDQAVLTRNIELKHWLYGLL
jgi:hypothetical protein